jgi:integrase
MAIAIGTNSINPVRRHLSGCTRFPKGSKQPLTHKPKTPQERKTDSCRCPIWCLGYLAKETEIKNGKLRPKRVFVSLGTTEWTSAEAEIASLCKLGALPAIAPSTNGIEIDKTAVMVRYAGERFLESRKAPSPDSIKASTLEKYNTLIKLRLFEYCEKNDIKTIRAFEDRDVCVQFAESWRQVRRNAGEFLGTGTRNIEMQRFSTFLNFCVDNEWIRKNGTDRIKGKGRRKSDEQERERYGLELDEYQQILDAPPSNDLTDQENLETLVAAELMRWCGPRISDAHNFNSAEIVPDESGDGWNCDFIQKKTGLRCVTPLPDHVKAQLDALPGRIENGVKYFFTCSYTALRMRVHTLAERAQKKKPFAHPFSPHCLRHTFAIQHFNHGTPVEYVSRWLGHETVAVTIKHYRRWIKTTRQIAESAGREANARMLAHNATLPELAEY